MTRRGLGVSSVGVVLGAALVVVLVLPLVALALSSSPEDIRAGTQSPLFAPALWLSLRTTVVSLAITVICGLPLAWWLATSSSRWARAVELLVDLPIVIPPAVIGVALLQTYGRRGLLGPSLEKVGLSIPFTEKAVVIAQVVVSAPFFVQAAANAFRKVDRDLLLVARTLGAPPATAFFRIAVPVALPGLVVGASLAWARSLGEFGATLLFAGNMPGTTASPSYRINITRNSSLDESRKNKKDGRGNAGAARRHRAPRDARPCVSTCVALFNYHITGCGHSNSVWAPPDS